MPGEETGVTGDRKFSSVYVFLSVRLYGRRTDGPILMEKFDCEVLRGR